LPKGWRLVAGLRAAGSKRWEGVVLAYFFGKKEKRGKDISGSGYDVGVRKDRDIC